MSTCNHKWSEETHEGVLSRCCHVCNEWEVELELHALEAELTSTKAAVIDAALIHAKLIQERDEARVEIERLRVACDGCADSLFKTGSAHYADCPVAVVQTERDELQAKLDAELPAAWREDLASLNECLERVGRERDTLREEVARLNTLLLSVTGENQQRAERELRALEDWRELRAENDRLKAIRNFDVEYARLDTMWQELVRERDAAVAKATAHERDWYEAKSEFGTAAAKLRDQVRELTKGRDELKARLAHAETDAEQAVHNEAFMERQRIVAWIRARHALGSLDCSLSLMALDALRVVADEIERGENREDGMIHERRP